VARLQHPAIVGDLVLAFLGRQQVVGIDVFLPDEHAEHASPPRLVDEVSDLMTLRVDLDDQGQLDVLVLLELTQPVEAFNARRTEISPDEPLKHYDLEIAGGCLQ
jgi:hypothetical protein